MGLEFGFSWALALLPLSVALIFWVDKRYQRNLRSLKSRATRGMRLLLTTVLVLAVSAPSILLPTGASTTWVLLDVSDSTSSVRKQTQEKLAEEIENLPKGEQVGVISFGANAMVEVPLSGNPSFTGANTAVNADGSNLTAALSLGSALLPAESTARILVISDGQTDDAKSMADALQRRGITLDVLKLETEKKPDAQVTEVAVPSEVYEGNAFSIQVAVDSTLDTQGTLVLYQNGTPTATRDVQLRKGENTFAFQDVATKTGVVTYEARLQAAGDEESQNNSASAYLYASGSPSVLVVEGKVGSGNELCKMLEAAGRKVERIAPQELATSPDAFRQYDSIVLANVEFDAVSEAGWAALESAVRTLGRGLCVFGGGDSYALGGYRGTMLETMLPVTIDVRDKLQMPALALMLVIDKSGSMTSGQFGTTRLEVAKEAAIRSTEVLTEKDLVGVIAFDDAAKWVVPLQNVKDVAAIQDLIGTIRPGGGTAFYSALEQSVSALIIAEAPQKHIIFLSDGEPGDTGFQPMATRANQNGITLTTVAVGSGANVKLMELLSTIGGGRAYTAGEFDNIPSIFTKETFLAGGTYVQNREFTPVVTEISTLTNFDGFPKLFGYLSTREKALASVALVSDREDPILAWWRYGAGTVLAWMSDTEGAWTDSFLVWENAASFFGGLVDKTLPQETRDGDLEVRTEENTARITYTMPEDASMEDGLRTFASVLTPEGAEESFELIQTDIGVYEGSFAADHQGAYALRIQQQNDNETVRVKEGGAVVSFSEEYDLRRQTEEGKLESLASATGGRVLGDQDAFFTKQEQGVRTRKQLTTFLCGMAMVLWLLDISLRKIAWEQAVLKWVHRKPEKGEPANTGKEAGEKKKVPQKKEPAKPAPSETTDKLLAAKRQRKQL